MGRRSHGLMAGFILLLIAPLSAQTVMPAGQAGTAPALSAEMSNETGLIGLAGEEVGPNPAASPTSPDDVFTEPATTEELYSQLQGPRPFLPAAPLRPALPSLPQVGASPFARNLAAGSPPQFLSSRSLDRTPFMIGDTSAGSCGSVDFLPGLGATFEHPTFSCSRLNVSENNSPLPRDRVYFRYNHFHNATKIAIFPTLISFGSSTLHIEKFTFGGEKTFLDGAASFEVRIPFAYELNSNILVQDIQGDDNLPIKDLNLEFGNVSFLTKYKMYESREAAVSLGLALNTPTSDNINTRVFVDDDAFEIFLPPGIQVGVVDVFADFNGTIFNDTFNLSPFAAAIWTPAPRWFTQGFVQFDLPLNSAETILAGTINVDGNQFDLPLDRGTLHQQALMRLNVGGGYWVYDNPAGRNLTGIAAQLELHYTTTLQDAKVQSTGLPIEFSPLLPPLPAALTVGNLSNRVDLMNLTIGGVFQFWNRTSIAHGFVLPLRSEGMDKPFDMEYQFQLNHLF